MLYGRGAWFEWLLSGVMLRTERWATGGARVVLIVAVVRPELLFLPPPPESPKLLCLTPAIRHRVARVCLRKPLHGGWLIVVSAVAGGFLALHSDGSCFFFPDV